MPPPPHSLFTKCSSPGALNRINTVSCRFMIQLKREQKNMSQEELLLYRERRSDSQVILRCSGTPPCFSAISIKGK